jgi:hypothetical protein
MLRNRESGVRKAHTALEEKAAKWIRPAKPPVDFGIQRAYEDESEVDQRAQLAKKVKPGCPSINQDVFGLFRPQNANEARQSAHAVGGKTGIEPSAGTNSYAFPNDSVGLTGVRGKDNGLVPARSEFPRKEGDLKFRSARGSL